MVMEPKRMINRPPIKLRSTEPPPTEKIPITVSFDTIRVVIESIRGGFAQVSVSVWKRNNKIMDMNYGENSPIILGKGDSLNIGRIKGNIAIDIKKE